jgi:hypothetical protein
MSDHNEYYGIHLREIRQVQVRHNKWYSNWLLCHHQISKAPGSVTLFARDIPNETAKLLRETTILQSIAGGQGMLKCDCKGGCKTNRCNCKQAKV